MNLQNSKTQLTLPVLLAGVVFIGGGMFFLGHTLAPSQKPIAEESSEAGSGKESAPNSKEEPGNENGPEKAEEGHEAGPITFSSEALESAGIQVAPVSLRPQVAGLPFNGAIEASPDNVARVASIVPGRITRLYVTIGQHVHKGQTLATVESRAVGEAQSAYAQATARLKNAQAAYDVTTRQAQAGVFSRTPVEAAKRAQVDASSDVRAGEIQVAQARMTLENTVRLARAGSFARPALEAARSQYASAQESLKTAQAALDTAKTSITAAQAELDRRRQIAAGGGYGSRPVEEAKRSLVAAQSARATAQSEVNTTRANLSRSKSLAAEGLISQRDLEAAQAAVDTAAARLETSQTDEQTAVQELQRQQKLSSSNAAGTAEVQDAEARLAAVQADLRSRQAEVERTNEGVQIASAALKREQSVFADNVANRREVTEARSGLATAKNALEKARATFAVSDAALSRELSIYRQNLNTVAQVQNAQAALVTAQSDFGAAETTLRLLRSSPGGNATVPIRSPLSGIVQTRDVAQGEVIEADRNIMTVVNLSTVHVDMFLPERDIASVRLGSPVQVTVDALPGRLFSGRIGLIHSELDSKTRTVEAHAVVLNPGLLRPGMFARGTIGTGSSILAVMVPADAVQDVEGKPNVFVPGEKAGQFEAREVSTGATVGGQTVIKSGLKPGERVVVKGAFMVKAQSMKSELADED